MWAKLDAAQLRGWQYLINFIGKHTGRSQYDVARFLAVLYISGSVADVFSYQGKELIGHALIGLLTSAATIFMFFMANSDERAAQRGFGGQLYIQRDYLHSKWNRLLQSTVLVSSLLGVFVFWRLRPTDFSYIGMWGFWYAMICDPPPPPQERESVENSVMSGA